MLNPRSYQLLAIFFASTVMSSCRKTEANRALNHVSKIQTTREAELSKEKVSNNRYLDTTLLQILQKHLAHDRPDSKWPVMTVHPLPGSILPFKRVVAYYGNFYSKGMGILGEVPAPQMLNSLLERCREWEQADSLIPVKPALHYIAVTAQRSPGKGNKYRLRMPDTEIRKAVELAKSIDAILFLDVQIGHSSLEEELPLLEPYLNLPNVHLGIDPEYSMKGGEVPCSKIGTFDAEDINYAASYLAALVRRNDLPPKILVIHRFTRDMVTNYRRIVLRPEVQIVMNMDGFGFPAKKIESYRVAIANEPVQFTGFKIFYKNDKLYPPYRLMTSHEILSLRPSPIYIQYQ